MKEMGEGRVWVSVCVCVKWEMGEEGSNLLHILQTSSEKKQKLQPDIFLFIEIGFALPWSFIILKLLLFIEK